MRWRARSEALHLVECGEVGYRGVDVVLHPVELDGARSYSCKVLHASILA